MSAPRGNLPYEGAGRPTPLTHTEAEALISARLDGPLDPVANRALNAHLAACPSCRAFAARVDVMARGLRALPHLPPSPTVSRQVRERVERGQTSWTRLLAWLGAGRMGFAPAAAAAMVVLAALAFVVITQFNDNSNTPSFGAPSHTVNERPTATSTPRTEALTGSPTQEPPTPTVAPTVTPTAMPNVVVTPPAPTPTATATSVPAPTVAAAAAPTTPPTATAAPTATATAAATATATATSEPTETATPEPTNTATPTATTVPPTATATVRPTEAATAAPTEPPATATSAPTATATATVEPTETATPLPTSTTEPTSTPSPEPTATATAEPTETPTPAPTETPTPEPTQTPTPKPTATATATAGPTNTPTPAPTPTQPPIILRGGPENGAETETPTVAAVGSAGAEPTVEEPTVEPTATATVEEQPQPTAEPTTEDNQTIEQTGPTEETPTPTPAPESTAETPPTVAPIAEETPTVEPTAAETAEPAANALDVADADQVTTVNVTGAPAGPLLLAPNGSGFVFTGGSGVAVSNMNGGVDSLGPADALIWSPGGNYVQYANYPNGQSAIATLSWTTDEMLQITSGTDGVDVPAGWIGDRMYYLRTFPGKPGVAELHSANPDGSDDAVVWTGDNVAPVGQRPVATGGGILIPTQSSWLLVGPGGDASSMGANPYGPVTAPTVSPGGSLVAYLVGNQVIVASVNSPGTAIASIPSGGSFDWSPDGEQIAVTDGSGVSIYTYDGRLVMSIANSTGVGLAAVGWTGDGIYILESSPVTGLFLMPASALSG